MDFDGRVLRSESKDVTVAPLRGDSYLSLDAGELLEGRDARSVFLLAELQAGGRLVSSNAHFFHPFKELSLAAPRVGAAVAAVPGGFKLRLSTDKLARAVYLSAHGAEGSFKDNFIDLVPGRPKSSSARPGARGSKIFGRG